MSLNSLINRLISADYFTKRYNNLLLHSVRTQFPILSYKAGEDEIDWKYLITCASLFAQSKEGKILDMAYRICQTCMTEQNVESEYRKCMCRDF